MSANYKIGDYVIFNGHLAVVYWIAYDQVGLLLYDGTKVTIGLVQ